MHILLLRYLFSFASDALVKDALDEGALGEGALSEGALSENILRSNPDEIAAYINTLIDVEE